MKDQRERESKFPENCAHIVGKTEQSLHKKHPSNKGGQVTRANEGHTAGESRCPSQFINFDFSVLQETFVCKSIVGLTYRNG